MSHFSGAWDYFLAGGPVMWPLAVVSVWLWALILGKAVWLIRARSEPVAYRDLLAEIAAGKKTHRPGPRRRALKRFLTLRTGRAKVDARLWQAAVRNQAPIIYRHLAAIAVLAAVAPLLGLLGTVSGMIGVFRAIMVYGTGNAHALAEGISQALITTQSGLVVAIPGLFAAFTLRRQARKVQQGLYTFQGLVDRLILAGEEAACSS